MTALCGGGTSQPKAGLDAFVTYTAGAIALALQARGASKLMPLIPLLGLGPLELSNLCSTDPPALPTLTEDEVFALLLFKLDADYFSGLGKFRDLVMRILWYELCECTIGSPTTFVNPTLPTNTPEPVTPPAGTVSPCVTLTNGPNAVAGTSFSFRGFLDFRVYPATSAVVTVVNTITSGTGKTAIVDLVAADNTGTIISGGLSVQNVTAPGATTVSTVPIDPNTHSLNVRLTAGTGTGDSTVSITALVYCGAAPGGTQLPCCPPDVATQAYLDQILAMVTLIQRQGVPFSYIEGVNHGPLSGDGFFTCAEPLIGMSVSVTTLPDSYGRADGVPVTLFEIGYVSLFTTSGFFAEPMRITSEGRVYFPHAAGVFTNVSYSLAPGVEVSIRELVRER